MGKSKFARQDRRLNSVGLCLYRKRRDLKVVVATKVCSCLTRCCHIAMMNCFVIDMFSNLKRASPSLVALKEGPWLSKYNQTEYGALEKR